MSAKRNISGAKRNIAKKNKMQAFLVKSNIPWNFGENRIETWGTLLEDPKFAQKTTKYKHGSVARDSYAAQAYLPQAGDMQRVAAIDVRAGV